MEITYSKQNILLKSPLPTPKGMISERNIIIYHFRNKQIELSPLPHLSKEKLEDAHSQVLKLLKILPSEKKIIEIIESSTFDLSSSEEVLISLFIQDLNFRVFPSVAFTLDQYILPLIIKYSKLPLFSEFNQSREVFFHQLVPDIRNHSINFSNHKVLKVKIGKYPIQEEYQFLNNLIQEFPAIKLKLDGNLSFNQKDLNEFLEGLDKHVKNQIIYIEEPLTTLSAHEALIFNLAIDENNQFFEDEFISTIIENDKVVARVYKPTLLAGYKKAFKHILNDQLNGIPIILSSCYEGPVATESILLFARLLNNNQSHGILSIE